jgi:hypothetical protein
VTIRIFRIELPRYRLLAASIAIFTISLFTAPVLARAQSGTPPLRVLLLPRLIPDALQQMLPLVFDAPAAGAASLARQKISVVAMVYCGGDSGAATAIGIAVPGKAAAVSPSLLSADDCAAPLGNVATRLMGAGTGPDWLEVVRLRGSWVPWHLTLAIADAAGAAKPGYTAPNLSRVGPIQSYNTTDLRLLTGAGANVGFDLAVGFPGSAITIVAAPTARMTIPVRYLNDSSVASEIANAPALSNVIVDAQYTFINQLLKLYGSTFDIPLPVEGVNETMTARNITVSGSDNLMTVAGDLIYRSLDYAGSVRCEGPELTVSQVTLDAPAPKCTQSDMMERLQCQGQSVASSGSSTALAAAVTQYYKGQPLHVSTRTQPLDFALGDANYQATFDALKSSSRGALFSEAGRATVRRADATP